MGGGDGRQSKLVQEPSRPVENVSFEEATAFLTRINGLVPGLALVLPTEAQWEYAARAGTKEASHAGRVKFNGQNNAPALDAIAWYGGNSGDIELVNAWNSSLWLESNTRMSALERIVSV